MKVTKQELIKIWGAFNALLQDTCHRKFAYAAIRNKKLMEAEIEALSEATKPTEGWQEFNTSRIKICQELCDKDEKGAPVINGTEFVITENAEESQKRLLELSDKHEKDIKEFNQREAEFKDVLEEEFELDPFKIKLSLFPEKITGSYLEILEGFILDDEEE